MLGPGASLGGAMEAGATNQIPIAPSFHGRACSKRTLGGWGRLRGQEGAGEIGAGWGEHVHPNVPSLFPNFPGIAERQGLLGSTPCQSAWPKPALGRGALIHSASLVCKKNHTRTCAHAQTRRHHAHSSCPAVSQAPKSTGLVTRFFFLSSTKSNAVTPELYWELSPGPDL